MASSDESCLSYTASELSLSCSFSFESNNSEKEYDSSTAEPYQFEPLASEGSDSNEEESDDGDDNTDTIIGFVTEIGKLIFISL